MKTKLTYHVRFCPAAFVVWLLISAFGRPAFAQGTAFTYQGRLNDSGIPANGSYDLTFSVWNAASGPAPVGGTLTGSPLFSVEPQNWGKRSLPATK